MFSRTNRLHGRAAKYTSRRGRVVSGPNFRAKWIPVRTTVTKATVVASLAFDKRAVKRNRAKRVIREALKTLLPRLRQPAHIMIYVNKGAAVKDFKKIKSELAEILTKARLL